MKEQIKTIKIKKRLGKYIDLLQEIDNQKKRLDLMEGAPASPDLSGMPRPKGGVSDPTGRLVDRRMNLEEKIKAKEAEEVEEREFIEGMIEQLESSDERAVMRLRYFDRYEWPDVTFILFGEKRDYIDQMDSYQNRTYKVHGRALLKMADILESIEE